jgi:hypothetical protein
MAVKTANDLGIFALLSQTTSFVTCEQLAAPKNADVPLVGMFPSPTTYVYIELIARVLT